MLPDFETYQVGIITKNVWRWHKESNRSMLQAGENSKLQKQPLCEY